MNSQDPGYREQRAAVTAALISRNFQEAHALAEQLTAENSGCAEAWQLGAECALRLGYTERAKKAIQKALTLEPKSPRAMAFYMDVLLREGKQTQSLAVARQLSVMAPKDAQVLAKLGYVFTAMQCYAEARDSFQRAVDLQPGNGLHHFNLGTALRASGDLERAEQCFDKAIALNPDEFEAFYARSGLRKQTVDANHTQELESLLAQPAADWRRHAHIAFALAKEYDDLKQYDRAFATLERGNHIRRQHIRYDVQTDEAKLEKIQAEYSRAVFQKPGVSSKSKRPIFVLGLPRSGSTLVDRILSAHSEVVSIGEVPNFGDRMVHLTRQSSVQQPASFDALLKASKQIDFNRLGQQYLESTCMYAGDSPYFVDKLPFNFLYIGLIHLAFPNAAIVHIHKNPMDACLGIYRILFRNAYPYAYDLNELARYWVAYRRLMDHWEAVLPGRVHHLAYEELVTDTEEKVRDLLNYCDLDWEENCLTFHANPEAATTASAVQVRQPIHRAAIDQWRHYEKQLAPLTRHFQQHGYI